eukprot:jgi/Mesvir1/27448/Mv07234-RA.1
MVGSNPNDEAGGGRVDPPSPVRRMQAESLSMNAASELIRRVADEQDRPKVGVWATFGKPYKSNCLPLDLTHQPLLPISRERELEGNLGPNTGPNKPVPGSTPGKGPQKPDTLQPVRPRGAPEEPSARSSQQGGTSSPAPGDGTNGGMGTLSQAAAAAAAAAAAEALPFMHLKRAPLLNKDLRNNNFPRHALELSETRFRAARSGTGFVTLIQSEDQRLTLAKEASEALSCGSAVKSSIMPELSFAPSDGRASAMSMAPTEPPPLPSAEPSSLHAGASALEPELSSTSLGLAASSLEHDGLLFTSRSFLGVPAGNEGRRAQSVPPMRGRVPLFLQEDNDPWKKSKLDKDLLVPAPLGGWDSPVDKWRAQFQAVRDRQTQVLEQHLVNMHEKRLRASLCTPVLSEAAQILMDEMKRGRNAPMLRGDKLWDKAERHAKEQFMSKHVASDEEQVEIFYVDLLRHIETQKIVCPVTLAAVAHIKKLLADGLLLNKNLLEKFWEHLAAYSKSQKFQVSRGQHPHVFSLIDFVRRRTGVSLQDMQPMMDAAGLRLSHLQLRRVPLDAPLVPPSLSDATPKGTPRTGSQVFKHPSFDGENNLPASPERHSPLSGQRGSPAGKPLRSRLNVSEDVGADASAVDTSHEGALSQSLTKHKPVKEEYQGLVTQAKPDVV